MGGGLKMTFRNNFEVFFFVPKPDSDFLRSTSLETQKTAGLRLRRSSWDEEQTILFFCVNFGRPPKNHGRTCSCSLMGLWTSCPFRSWRKRNAFSRDMSHLTITTSPAFSSNLFVQSKSITWCLHCANPTISLLDPGTR